MEKSSEWLPVKNRAVGRLAHTQAGNITDITVLFVERAGPLRISR
jgi:hypothetical protein